MKRFIVLCFAVCLSFAIALPAYAFKLPSSIVQIRDGDTYIRILKTSLLTESQKEFTREWFQTENPVCYYNENQQTITFMLFDKNVPLDHIYYSDSNDVAFGFSAPVSARYVVFDSVTLQPKYSTVQTTTYGTSNVYLFWQVITWRYFQLNDSDFNSIPHSAFLEYTGKLVFEDDGGLTGDSDDGGVLGWLSSFWEKLKNMFLSLFVPRDGYLNSWFADIRTAFDSKTGGLSASFSSFQSSVSALTTAPEQALRLDIVLPNNWLYSGYRGTTVNLLGFAGGFFSFIRLVFNGIIVFFTGIACYQKLTDTIKG